MTFGIFTDLHYSMKNNDEERFFRNVPDKLCRCMDYFEKAQVEFMICLGDLVDCKGDKAQQRLLMNNVKSVLCAKMIPLYLCLGNHDVVSYSYSDIMQEFMPNCPREYYSFDREGIHFIVLDTNYSKMGEHYTKESMCWNNLYIDEIQIQWLHQDLSKAMYPVIICTHGNLDERETDGILDPHIVRNHKEVKRIIDGSGKVCLVLQGHYHKGGCSWQNKIPYLTIPALVDGEKKIPLALIRKENNDDLSVLLFDIGEDEKNPKEKIFIKI